MGGAILDNPQTARGAKKLASVYQKLSIDRGTKQQDQRGDFVVYSPKKHQNQTGNQLSQNSAPYLLLFIKLQSVLPGLKNLDPYTMPLQEAVERAGKEVQRLVDTTLSTYKHAYEWQQITQNIGELQSVLEQIKTGLELYQYKILEEEQQQTRNQEQYQQKILEEEQQLASNQEEDNNKNLNAVSNNDYHDQYQKEQKANEEEAEGQETNNETVHDNDSIKSFAIKEDFNSEELSSSETNAIVQNFKSIQNEEQDQLKPEDITQERELIRVDSNKIDKVPNTVEFFEKQSGSTTSSFPSPSSPQRSKLLRKSSLKQRRNESFNKSVELVLPLPPKEEM